MTQELRKECERLLLAAQPFPIHGVRFLYCRFWVFLHISCNNFTTKLFKNKVKLIIANKDAIIQGMFQSQLLKVNQEIDGLIDEIKQEAQNKKMFHSGYTDSQKLKRVPQLLLTELVVLIKNAEIRKPHINEINNFVDNIEIKVIDSLYESVKNSQDYRGKLKIEFDSIKEKISNIISYRLNKKWRQKLQLFIAIATIIIAVLSYYKALKIL